MVLWLRVLSISMIRSMFLSIFFSYVTEYVVEDLGDMRITKVSETGRVT